MPHFEEPDGFQRAVSNAADRLAGDYSNEQYGLAPKLWTHLKRARMRKEGFHTEAVTLYLTIQRKSPTADTMRLCVWVMLLWMIRLRLCF